MITLGRSFRTVKTTAMTEIVAITALVGKATDREKGPWVYFLG